MRDICVRIGDINSDGEMGEIAFVAAYEVDVRDLDGRRLYI